MSLYLYFVLVACFCHSFTDTPKKTFLQNTMAILPCPHREGDVIWSRYINGEKVILVSIESGIEKIPDKHYGSLADNSLLIHNVKPSDSAMYLCNGAQIYLEVTTDPNMVDHNAGNVPVTERKDESAFGLGPAAAGDADTESQQSSDSWKVPVGVVMGAALALLAVLSLRFCSKKRRETNTSLDKTVAESIYEEIEAGVEQPRRESDVESPYYCTSITPCSSTPPNNNLYSAVNKLKTKGPSSEECVYYLAQNPPQTVSCQRQC
ncbi:uncharacterized protein LOC121604573 [Chelmon rostratus]|uniref:uncharacterized protein LOC121604573 n=1 Tax=Chelmon rostratus TaxID=109905 RepID=UPI001BE5016F|nr:uncharacterized protein LOC121604573 [Chelmon rostratus]